MRKQCLAVIQRVQGRGIPEVSTWVLNFTPEALTKDNYSTSTWLCGLNMSG